MSAEIRRNFVIAFFVVATFGPVMWMVLDRTPPYRIIGATIEPKVVRAGDDVRVTFTIEQERPLCGPGLVYRELREANGRLDVFDPVPRATSPVIVDNRFSRIVNIPRMTSPGTVTYRGNACYTCNPVHSWLRWPVCVPTPEVQLTVLPAADQQQEKNQ